MSLQMETCQPGEVAGRGASWSISCDFDGTITRGDMLQALLNRFADPSWRTIEAEWEAGRIGSRTCLERQTRLIRASAVELAEWVESQPVDPDVAGFFADCARLGLPARVVSDGYDWVIRRVMRRLGLADVPVFANRLTPMGEDRWSVTFPHARPDCASGACKCGVVAQAGGRAHIGDGRSDFCVSETCELVFAKSALLAQRGAKGLASIPFDSFSQIRVALPGLALRETGSEGDVASKVAC